MKLLKLRLTLDVEIDPQGLTADDCKQYITRMVNHGIANGLLTGDSPATVEHYKFDVTTEEPSIDVLDTFKTPCPHCGREEHGEWFSPCPSDDCPSHDHP